MPINATSDQNFAGPITLDNLVDSKGRPTTYDKTVPLVCSSSDETVLRLPNPDGSAGIEIVAAGTARITVTADVREGPDTNSLTFPSDDVVVTIGTSHEAVSGLVGLGTLVDKP